MKSPIAAHNWTGRVALDQDARFVLTITGTVYQSDNQDLPGLAIYAGKMVIVSGAMSGNAIHISALALATE
jgi:hypothetical protein